MKILKSIGGVFVKIWRWIKNTAWVQPLLIVGAIFGIIFSIPAITSGIQGIINSKNNADNFFSGYKLSLSGGVTSSADQLIERYDSYKTKKEEEIPEADFKYFLMFTNSGNAASKDIKTGFEVLRDNWNNLYKPTDGRPFKLYTIYTDESTSETTKTKTAFAQFLDRKSQFFATASENAERTDYYRNGKITKTDLETLDSADASTFKTPTIILVDWGDKVNPGIAEVTFSVTGTDEYSRAKFLMDCWNKTGDFGPSKP